MRRIAERVLYQGRWRTFAALDVEFDDGVRATYEHLSGEGMSVAVVAVDDDHLVLVRQPRPVIGNRACLEIVQGGVEPGEAGVQAAQRELREETGLRAAELQLLRTVHVDPTLMPGHCELYLARGLTADPLPGDDGERIEVTRRPVEEFDRVLGEVTEAVSVIGLLMLRDLLRQGR